MSKKTIPAVSIVIPMYNAEKYIGECLDSILAQTFDDYEVIVVDDCSKDNSAAIVESYVPKFKDKLQLVRSRVNSGGAGKPRNIGLKISRGEYIFFMDSDDVIMNYALQELYDVADKFQAEVVHCDRVFLAPSETVTTDKKLLRVLTLTNADQVTAPTLKSRTPVERVKDFVSNKMRCEPWSHFVRRDFLMTNELQFSKLSVADDMLFSFCTMCLAEKIVLIPEAFYVWRTRADSNSKEVLPPEKCIQRRAGDIFRAIEILDKFLDQFEEFSNNKQIKFAVFDFFALAGGGQAVLPLYTQIPAHQLDGLVRRELAQLDDTTALTAFLFGRMNIFNVNILQQRQLIQKQQQQIQQLQSQLNQLQQTQQQFHLNTEDIFK